MLSPFHPADRLSKSKSYARQRVRTARAAEHQCMQRFRIQDGIHPRKKAAHAVSEQDNRQPRIRLAGKAVHFVQILQHKFASVLFGKIAVCSVRAAACGAVSQMVVAANHIAFLRHIPGKIVITADVFAHAVGNLQDTARFHPGTGVIIPRDDVRSIGGLKADGVFLYFRHLQVPPLP